LALLQIIDYLFLVHILSWNLDHIFEEAEQRGIKKKSETLGDLMKVRVGRGRDSIFLLLDEVKI
jgi:hypothetical protein